MSLILLVPPPPALQVRAGHALPCLHHFTAYLSPSFFWEIHRNTCVIQIVYPQTKSSVGLHMGGIRVTLAAASLRGPRQHGDSSQRLHPWSPYPTALPFLCSLVPPRPCLTGRVRMDRKARVSHEGLTKPLLGGNGKITAL